MNFLRPPQNVAWDYLILVNADLKTGVYNFGSMRGLSMASGTRGSLKRKASEDAEKKALQMAEISNRVALWAQAQMKDRDDDHVVEDVMCRIMGSCTPGTKRTEFIRNNHAKILGYVESYLLAPRDAKALAARQALIEVGTALGGVAHNLKLTDEALKKFSSIVNS